MISHNHVTHHLFRPLFPGLQCCRRAFPLLLGNLLQHPAGGSRHAPCLTLTRHSGHALLVLPAGASTAKLGARKLQRNQLFEEA